MEVVAEGDMMTIWPESTERSDGCSVNEWIISLLLTNNRN